MRRFFAHCIAMPQFAFVLLLYPFMQIWIYLWDGERGATRRYYADIVNEAEEWIEDVLIHPFGRLRPYSDDEMPAGRRTMTATQMCPVCTGEGTRKLLNGTIAPCTECGGSRFVKKAA